MTHRPPPPQRMAGDAALPDYIIVRRSELLLAMLTPQQRRILWARASGDSIGEVGLRYGISTQTVRSHLASISRRIGKSGLIDLLTAVEWLKVPPEPKA